MGIKPKIRVLGDRILIVLRIERDLPAVGKKHPILLQRASHDARRRRKLRHIEVGLQAEMGPIGQCQFGTLWATGVRCWMHEDVGAYPPVGKNESNRMVDASSRQLVGVKEERGNGKSRSVRTPPLIAAPRWGINSTEIPYRKRSRTQRSIRIVCLIRFIELMLGAVHNAQSAIASIAPI